MSAKDDFYNNVFNKSAIKIKKPQPYSYSVDYVSDSAPVAPAPTPESIAEMKQIMEKHLNQLPTLNPEGLIQGWMWVSKGGMSGGATKFKEEPKVYTEEELEDMNAGPFSQLPIQVQIRHVYRQFNPECITELISRLEAKHGVKIKGFGYYKVGQRVIGNGAGIKGKETEVMKTDHYTQNSSPGTGCFPRFIVED